MLGVQFLNTYQWFSSCYVDFQDSLKWDLTSDNHSGRYSKVHLRVSFLLREMGLGFIEFFSIFAQE
jgi:hypothetical protein